MFLDESVDMGMGGLAGPPPPPALLPELSGVIGQAVAHLREGRSGFVFLHEKTQDGRVNQTNAVLVKRFGDNIVATCWLGRTWSAPGTVSYGASLAWEFD